MSDTIGVPKSFDRIRRRYEGYRKHHEDSLPRHERTTNGHNDQQKQETQILRQRFLESKAKKSTKKSEKKTDGLGQKSSQKRLCEEFDSGGAGNGGGDYEPPSKIATCGNLNSNSTCTNSKPSFKQQQGGGNGSLSQNAKKKSSNRSSPAPSNNPSMSRSPGMGGPTNSTNSSSPSNCTYPPILPNRTNPMEFKQEPNLDFVSLDQCMAAVEKDVGLDNISDLMREETGDGMINSATLNDLISDLSEYSDFGFMKEFGFEEADKSDIGLLQALQNSQVNQNSTNSSNINTCSSPYSSNSTYGVNNPVSPLTPASSSAGHLTSPRLHPGSQQLVKMESPTEPICHSSSSSTSMDRSLPPSHCTGPSPSASPLATQLNSHHPSQTPPYCSGFGPSAIFDSASPSGAQQPGHSGSSTPNSASSAPPPPPPNYHPPLTPTGSTGSGVHPLNTKTASRPYSYPSGSSLTLDSGPAAQTLKQMAEHHQNKSQHGLPGVQQQQQGQQQSQQVLAGILSQGPNPSRSSTVNQALLQAPPNQQQLVNNKSFNHPSLNHGGAGGVPNDSPSPVSGMHFGQNPPNSLHSSVQQMNQMQHISISQNQGNQIVISEGNFGVSQQRQQQFYVGGINNGGAPPLQQQHSKVVMGKEKAKILKQQMNKINEDGSYSFGYGDPTKLNNNTPDKNGLISPDFGVAAAQSGSKGLNKGHPGFEMEPNNSLYGARPTTLGFQGGSVDEVRLVPGGMGPNGGSGQRFNMPMSGGGGGEISTGQPSYPGGTRLLNPHNRGGVPGVQGQNVAPQFLAGALAPNPNTRGIRPQFLPRFTNPQQNNMSRNQVGVGGGGGFENGFEEQQQRFNRFGGRSPGQYIPSMEIDGFSENVNQDALSAFNESQPGMGQRPVPEKNSNALRGTNPDNVASGADDGSFPDTSFGSARPVGGFVSGNGRGFGQQQQPQGIRQFPTTTNVDSSQPNGDQFHLYSQPQQQQQQPTQYSGAFSRQNSNGGQFAGQGFSSQFGVGNRFPIQQQQQFFPQQQQSQHQQQHPQQNMSGFQGASNFQGQFFPGQVQTQQQQTQQQQQTSGNMYFGGQGQNQQQLLNQQNQQFSSNQGFSQMPF